ncbi:hypothetical protein E4O05_07680 [Treponema sp. OMZ 787]|uniref:hypothetical protein n=1 Tax=Treponema sp. OMZ 787 TaxID=2563669 RepID=UPI0020A23EC6|nr:hypothetical protein [Treponema sp. OMZ 787]UTC61440.1 hypothetical protein E4O05_07680 [Treponema sp. OMZ 787]
MKKILLPILFFALIFSSCSLFFQDEYGTVTIDLEGGNARSINSSTGLPNIADSELEIEIAMGGTRSLYKKILASEPKFFQANFPIGARLEINIKLNGPSSSWSANAKHTVKEGNNDIQLLLNKNASALATLSFSVNDDESNEYEFNIAGRTIEISSSKEPVFTRDSRGRLYIAYKDDRTWKLNRYESDGVPNNFADSSNILRNISHAESVALASDPVKGKVYAASNSKLCLIKDDGSTVTISAAGLSIPTGPFTVYDNKLFVLEPAPNPSDVNLKIYKIKDEYGSLIASQVGNPVSISKQQIKMETNYIQVDFKDILVKKDKIYLLFAKKNLISPIFYSLGGMLEYTYNSSEIIETPQKWGFNDTADFDSQSSIITAGEAHFYGPVRFIGYDEQNIYIADDGCTIQKNDNDYKIKNVNRIFSFNTSTKTLSYSATENKWFEEHKSLVSPPPSPITGKVLLWEKNSNPNLGMVYYQVNYKNDEGNYDNLPEAFIKGTNTTGYPHYPTDVFCHDEKGNLYILWINKAGSTPKKYQYKVRKYVLLPTGNYDSNYDVIQLEEFNNKNTPITEISVYVSESDSYLYYTYKDGSTYIKRLKWTDDNFGTASKDNSFNQQINDNGGSKSFCTALAVNKDGVFAAVKTIAGTDIENPNTYGFNIKKYKHTNIADGKTLSIGNRPPTSADNYYLKDIFDLQIIDGILYGIKTTKTGKLKNGTTSKVSTSGELFKIESLNSSFSNSTAITTLWTSSPTDGYAPYRFIGMIPNKLIIASDGYYGDKGDNGNEAQNANNVLSFDINTSSSAWTVTPKDTGAKFSRKLSYLGQDGFDWK